MLEEVLADREGTGGGREMGLVVAMEKRKERREEVEERDIMGADRGREKIKIKKGL